MEKKQLKIELGVGINEFRFGITRDTLRDKAGAPDEIEENEEPDDLVGKIEVWHYDEFDLSAEFIEGNDWRLSTIAINSEECTLEGVTLIGKKLNEVKNLLETLKLGEYEAEKLNLEENHDIVMLSVFDQGIDFWFEDDILTEIQLIPVVD